MADTDDLTKIVKDLGAVSKSMLEASKSMARLTKDLAGVVKAVADVGRGEEVSEEPCCGFATSSARCNGCPDAKTRSVTINLDTLSDAPGDKGIAEQIAEQISKQSGCGGGCGGCGKAKG